MHHAREMNALLTRFLSTPPRFKVSQQRSLEWLAEAHGIAEGSPGFAARIARVLERCACPPSKIAQRHFSIGDLDNLDWNNNVLYDLRRDPHGCDTGARTRVFGNVVDEYFTETYSTETDAPDDLIHVTCTGYLSPSGAQKLVARRRWPTRVTHAYQMGCYAAVPALRIAAGLLADRRRVDIVHTELCSLHLDATDHRIEQLVVQSLFADGLIRYSMIPDDGRDGLRIVATHELIVPESSESMSWTVGAHGMQMTLARDVPERIAGVLRAFVLELFRRGGLSIGAIKHCIFAVHPGGPKIIDGVRDVLELDERQVQVSRDVLRDHGNMSSATLPHVWQRLLEDPTIPRGTVIPSLAFGPGLTICGALLEKR
jgi:predicted naringenin-chalcone synthase